MRLRVSDFKPWEDPLTIWKTKANYFTWLRGNLRRIWSDNPLRKVWKAKTLRPVTKDEKDRRVFHPSTKNVGQCYLCNKWMAGSKLECDHLIPSNGCYSFDTAQEFLWHCAASAPKNWALACSPCHKIKSYADKQGISYEEAKVTKEAIEIIKKKEDRTFLESKGITPAGNAKGRREQIINYLRGN